MKRNLMLVFILLALVPLAFAQELNLPRPSQKASVMQTIGLTDVTITYSRPGVKERVIWGGLVPYDKVWRTGANEATTIRFREKRNGRSSLTKMRISGAVTSTKNPKTRSGFK